MTTLLIISAVLVIAALVAAGWFLWSASREAKEYNEEHDLP